MIPSKSELELVGIRVAVAVPMERTVPSAVFPSFWAIAARGWPILPASYGRTDVQRNRFAQTLLDSDFTHVLMLDLDHIHPPDIVERHAARVLDDPDKQVIAGMHFRRGEPFEPCMFVYSPQGTLHAITDWPQGRCIEVHALGHGSLLVHRSVFETLPKPWWAYDYGQAERDAFPSEDMYFCYLCREHGIRLWVDTAISSPHLINNVVTEDVFRQWMADHPEKEIG